MSEKTDKVLAKIIVYSWLLKNFNSGIVRLTFLNDDLITSLYKGMVMILTTILFAYGAELVFKRRFWFAIKACGFFVFLYLGQGFLYPENTAYLLDTFFKFFFMAFPYFIYMSAINDYKILHSVQKNVLPIYTIHSALCLLIRFFKGYWEYDMSFGYATLLPTCLYFWEYKEKGKRSNLFFALFNAAAMFMASSRGAMFCLSLYVIWLFIFKGEYAFVKLSWCSIIITIGAFFKEIMNLIYEFFISFGIFIRTFYLFANHLNYSSGRDELYRKGIEMIINNPFTGAGLASDRVINSYVHNIFLEVWIDFGIILGTVILIVFAIVIFLAFSSKAKRTEGMLPIFFTIGVMPLLVSGSYLETIPFWMFVGMAVNIVFLMHKRVKILY